MLFEQTGEKQESRDAPFLKFNTKSAHNLLAEAPSVGAQCSFLGRCTIGAFSYVGIGKISATDIGRYCSIAHDVIIGPTNHPTDRFTTHLIAFGSRGPFGPSKEFETLARNLPAPGNNARTVIGNDVWIGAKALVKRGVTIGDGAVIGGGSVVVKDVEPYSIVGGSPARHIRYRFDKTTRDRLLALRWWNYDIEDAALTDEHYRDVHAFLEHMEERALHGRLKPLEPARFLITKNGVSRLA